MTVLRWSSVIADERTRDLTADLSGAAGLTLLVVDRPDEALDLGPLIGRGFVVASVGSPNPSADLVIDEAEVDSLAERCEAHPHASAIAAQQLRLAEQLPDTAALVSESLAYATLQAGPEHVAWLETNQQRRRVRKEYPEPSVEVTEHANRVAVRLNRPRLKNALTTEMRNALVEAFSALAHRPDLELIEVSGAGSNFCIGGDLAEFGTVADPATAHTVRMGSSVARCLVDCSTPVTFYLHGACVGAGVELAAFGDIVVASSDTTLALPEVDLGLIPGAGGSVSLTNRIGRQAAARLLLVDTRIDAPTALAIGLVDQIAD